MKRGHTIEQLKEIIAWKLDRKQDPSFWQAKLQEAINADLKATVKSRKARKAA